MFGFTKKSVELFVELLSACTVSVGETLVSHSKASINVYHKLKIK